MKKLFINLISFLMALLTVLSLTACDGDKPDKPDNTEPDVSKSTIQEPVKIVEIPTDEKELAEMLNGAIDYVELYCYHYTKHTTRKVSDVSVGTLSSVPNAVDAFKSVFGEKDVSFDYEYNTSKEAFKANFPEGGYTVDELRNIKAEQSENSIIITAELPDEANPSETGLLYKLCADTVNTASVEKALSDFNSSATSVGVSAYDIKLKATISAQDSSLTELEISYTQRYSLAGVTLVKLEGSSVSAVSNTIVKYTDIGV